MIRRTRVLVALLRAINVGGTGTLAMRDLRGLCEGAGFADVRTYIQSGNVVMRSALDEKKTRVVLEDALAAKMGRPVGVQIRSVAELEDALAGNPFPAEIPSRVVVVFLAEAPARGALASVAVPGREELQLRGRELFIHYPDGIGGSRLKVPFAREGTARNVSTVTRLLAMAREMA